MYLAIYNKQHTINLRTNRSYVGSIPSLSTNMFGMVVEKKNIFLLYKQKPLPALTLKNFDNNQWTKG